MILKLPLFGWFSTKKLICAMCKQEIGYHVHGDVTDNNLLFHDDCYMDYVAEKEGWTEYRERYKSIQKKYGGTI